MPKILVGDGDQTFRDIFHRLLARHGYDVEVASGGVDCVAKLRRSFPDLLILDLNLPWGGGDGVLAWIREESPTHGVPVVLTGAADYPEEVAEIIDPPVVDYVTKPFRPSVLLEKVASAVAKKGNGEPSNLNRVPPCPKLFIG